MSVIINGTTGITSPGGDVSSADNTVNGITVGKGGGAVATSTTVGYQGLNAQTAGPNDAFGYQSMLVNTSGSYNVAYGYYTLKANTTGSVNSAFGNQALAANTTGSSNSAVGVGSLLSNTTGGNNTAMGDSALRLNTTASNNTAVGYQAGYSNTTGQYNTFLGMQTGYGGTTAVENTFVGYNVGFNGGGTNTGSYTVGVGKDALHSLTTGSYNVALGNASLFSNTTASYNTAVGYQAGYSVTTGAQSVFVGYQAGNVTTGTENCFVGSSAGLSNTTGNYNTYVGRGASTAAGYLMTTGSKNTILGGFNGNQNSLDIRTASNYIVLSDGDGNPCAYRSGANNGWYFGNGGTSSTYDGVATLNGAASNGRGAALVGLSNGANSWVAGSYSYVVSGTSTFFAVSNTGGGVYLNGASATSWTAVSDETRKDIIEPITGGLAKVATLRTVIGKLKTDEEGVRRPYLIAQDVQAVLPEAVSEAEDKEGKVLGLSYTEVIPLLVNAIQELKAEVDSLKQQLGK
jgi:hypothetical protein